MPKDDEFDMSATDKTLETPLRGRYCRRRRRCERWKRICGRNRRQSRDACFELRVGRRRWSLRASDRNHRRNADDQDTDQHGNLLGGLQTRVQMIVGVLMYNAIFSSVPRDSDEPARDCRGEDTCG